jgi:hypothetical protein
MKTRDVWNHLEEFTEQFFEQMVILLCVCLAIVVVSLEMIHRKIVR